MRDSETELKHAQQQQKLNINDKEVERKNSRTESLHNRIMLLGFDVFS